MTEKRNRSEKLNQIQHHLVETAIRAVEDEGNFAPFEALLRRVTHPSPFVPADRDYALPPARRGGTKNFQRNLISAKPHIYRISASIACSSAVYASKRI